jgi:hypothetical protein
LDILDLSGFQPIPNNLDLGLIHRKFVGQKNVAQEFYCFDAECTFFEQGKKPSTLKALKHFTYMLSMFRRIFRINEDVVQIYNNIGIEEV